MLQKDFPQNSVSLSLFKIEPFCIHHKETAGF